MIRKSKLPELLSPAGDFESLVAAVAGGADAVYVGGKSFGARAYAKNFNLDELSRATVYCHLHHVKIYVTVNTLVYDKELPLLCEYAKKLWEIGVDALIISDLGAIKAIKMCVPDLELHASTQMSVHSSDGAKIAAKLGCSRVVLARELSYENIVKATQTAPIETEVFVHGALCVCHSGQCLFSSLVGGRSGNRGECAQPCRLPYGKAYPLSLSDLSLAEHIEKLIASGVSSLKIEGRMKSPNYVYTVTKIYRKLLDENRSASENEKKELAEVFSRDGFTDKYFTAKLDEKMTGIRREENKNLARNSSGTHFEPQTRVISAEAIIASGEPTKLSFSLDGRTVSVIGDIPSEAISSPLSEDSVKERLSRLGGTFLSLPKENIKLYLDDGLNLSPASLNALRRSAVQALTDERRAPTLAEASIKPKQKSCEKLNTALFLKSDLLSKLYKNEISYFDIVFVPLFDFSSLCDKANGIYIPPIVLDTERERVKNKIEEAVKMGAKFALIGNLGHVELISEIDIKPIGDFRLNITNSLAKEAYAELGINTSIVSAEATLPMARDIGGGAIIYGRIPLMLTERCFIKENFGCRHCSDASFTDRLGEKFPVIREFEHRNLILNSQITYMADKTDELNSASILHRHSIFTVEDESQARFAISAIKNSSPLKNVKIRRMGKREFEKTQKNKSVSPRVKKEKRHSN